MTTEDLMKLLGDFPEINPSNYGDDDVNALNAWGIAAHTALEALGREVAELKELADSEESRAVNYRREKRKLEAEVETLKGYRDRALELATAYNNSQENIEQICAHRDRILNVNDTLRAELAAIRAQEPEKSATQFWQGIYPDGWTAERFEAEMTDYHALLDGMDSLIMHVTGGACSKPLTHKSVIKSLHDDYMTRSIEEAIADAQDESEDSPAAKDAGLVADDRITECAKRLVEHADFQLGGILSADSKAKDIPSKAVSQVKSRHLAALRDALAASPKIGGV